MIPPASSKLPTGQPTRRSISIRAYLILGIGVVLALVAAITIASGVGMQRLQAGMQQTTDEAARLRELALTLQNTFLLARQAEADFLASVRAGGGYDASAATALEVNQEHIASARRLLAQLSSLVSESQTPSLAPLAGEIADLLPLIDQYEAAFLATAGYYEQRGQPNSSATLIRTALSRLENIFAPLDNPAYLIRVLKIRANEQAYFATNRQEFTDNIHIQASQLIELLQNATAEDVAQLSELPSSLMGEVEAYLSSFDQVTILDRNAQINTVVFQEITEDISRLTSEIDTQSTIAIASSNLALEQLRAQTTLGIGAAGLAALVLGGLVAIASIRNITSPLNKLRQAAELLGQGDLSQRVDIRRGAELITLAETFNSMAGQLQQTLAGLEQRVAERTQALERRSAQILAAAEIARDAASARDLNVLLNRAVNLVRDRFGFYHAGLFLLDEAGEFAVLQAATGEAGSEMLNRRHRLKVGEVGMVGFTAHTGQPRIASDVGADATHFRNPLLPETHSEMSLPLTLGRRVIGVLDVQSRETAAFSQEDVTVLQTMADQLAIAIDNARLAHESQENVRQIEKMYGRFSQESWERIVESAAVLGYQYDGSGLSPIRSEAFLSPEASGAENALRLPLKVRGQEIAALEIWPRGGENLPIAAHILDALGERIGQAMESARIFEETQTRAAREQTLNQLVARLTRTLDLETLIQTAAQELNSIPGVTEVAIHISPADSGGRTHQPG